MKKSYLFGAMLALGVAFTAVSCGDDTSDSNSGNNSSQVDATDLDYTSSNADAWGNYMMNTARLLNTDANNLYNQWAVDYNKTGKSFAELFKAQDQTCGYGDVDACIQEMIEKMGEIANEVGSSKIGDPYDKWTNGKTTDAVLAVESWYSWHSRDDYTNNIISIRNAFYGSRDGSIAQNSLAKALEGTAIATKVKQLIQQAQDDIQGITQPFRNHIGTPQVVTAMNTCADLQKALGEISTDDGDKAGDATNLKEEAKKLDEATKKAIINNYVDAVVVPTYKELAEKNTALKAAVDAFAAAPSNAGFEACCTAWINARQPWETSEAFLFGPVDELGLDPNMDSWPLDAEGISNVMKNKAWADLEWDKDDDEAKVESAQNVRGFHTLEFLIFKNGKARTVK